MTTSELEAKLREMGIQQLSYSHADYFMARRKLTEGMDVCSPEFWKIDDAIWNYVCPLTPEEQEKLETGEWREDDL